MLKRMGIAFGMMATLALANHAFAGDHAHACCEKASANNAWCSGCKVGFFDGEKMTCNNLHTALAGMKVDAAKAQCDGCKKAIASNGTCDHCKVSVADGVAYKSPVAYALMVGTPMEAEKAAAMCKDCGAACKSGGWCSECKVGFVAGRMYKGEEQYKAAKDAHQTLVNAIKACDKCEGCAVAMVTNGTCAQCKVSFENGKKKAA
ncbi:MAG: hypothetical protein AB7N71_09735 [Phycisphaerae bacterium]